MKHLIILVTTMMFGSLSSVAAQDDYYIKKAQSYQREAEYYQKKADEKAAMYLRWAADALSKR